MWYNWNRDTGVEASVAKQVRSDDRFNVEMRGQIPNNIYMTKMDINGDHYGEEHNRKDKSCMLISLSKSEK